MEQSGQSWDPREYDAQARFVSALGESLIAWLSPQPGERVLDLGCGDGALTAKLRDTGADVLGVDSSEPMLEAARMRGLDVRLMDGERLSFDAEFDAVFSNAALHWMRNPDAVLAGVRRALKPGGRFVGEFGGHGNVAALCVAMFAVLGKRGIDAKEQHPWYFPTPEEYREKLAAHGFTTERIELNPRPTALPAEMKNWYEMFAGPMLVMVPEDERPQVCKEAQDLLKPVLCDSPNRWTADYVRLRFAARQIR